MSERLGIGKIITSTQYRDAIHISVAPVTAGCSLMPCEHVSMRDGKAYLTPSNDRQSAVGIVDPFLQQEVIGGQQFWLFLYPGSIYSLRHHWEHPAFPAESATDIKLYAENRIREYADRLGVDFDTLISDATAYYHKYQTGAHGSYYPEGEAEYMGSDAYYDEGALQQFWADFEVYTGQSVLPSTRKSFFVCDC